MKKATKSVGIKTVAAKTKVAVTAATQKAVMPSTAPKPGCITLELIKPGASRVMVAGSFNGWRPEESPLKPEGNGVWTGNLEVKPGRHEYLFVVDGSWMPDPKARENVANPFGGLNSVLTVSA